MKLLLRNVNCGYSQESILRDINLSFNTGEFWCILGANGIGKTTLFKTILGFIKTQSGEILIDDRYIYSLSNKEIAKFLSYVPQAKNYTLKYSVLDIVLMGRVNHIKQFSSPSKRDYEITELMLEKLGILHLKHCLYSELSGGEQQIVLIARALAQEAKFILMDEPASNLDFENQKRILDVMIKLINNDVGIIMSSHSPDHAFYCDANVVLIKRDKKIISGKAVDIITKNNMKEGYGVDVEIISGMDSLGNPISACRLL